MELLDLVIEIERYCARNNINPSKMTVSVLTSLMIDAHNKED